MAADKARESGKGGYDVVIVGGGPAGCSAGVFTARYGLDTAIFDRGNAALRRSAFLANYLGFPAGIDIDTFYELMHDHAREAGCELISEMVVSIQRPPPKDSGQSRSDSGFLVETNEGRTVTANRIIAAAWYDGEYLRPLGGDELFERHEHHGEELEQFDRGYPDEDGRTPIEGLYVAAPNNGRNAQAITSAGQGAHVARSLLDDYRQAEGLPEGVLSSYFDWLRTASEFKGEWESRDRWREWFENELPDDHGLDRAELEQLRERYIDRAFDTRLFDSEIERRTERSHRRMLDYIEDDLVLERAQEVRATRTEGTTQDSLEQSNSE